MGQRPTLRLVTPAEAYIARRDQILTNLDVDGMIALMVETGARPPSDREVALAALHKARTGCTSMPMHLRSISKRWLLERAMGSLDDGDVPC